MDLFGGEKGKEGGRDKFACVYTFIQSYSFGTQIGGERRRGGRKIKVARRKKGEREGKKRSNYTALL